MYNDFHGGTPVDRRRGGGGKRKLEPWRQIETTPEQDSLVDTEEINNLLSARDRARRAKNFAKADRLLEEATHAPGEPNVVLRIHDESRTWRIWVENQSYRMKLGKALAQKSPGELCLDIVREHAPHKVDELTKILAAFPGREYKILKSVKKQYLGRETSENDDDNGEDRASP
uniref:Uncharacterized protein n=1 Tax=Grammatophora oceanica TaxID=210454 RepID=A0A7S1YEV8_9STRA|mmetsp:Transcript_42701/g.63339  ORF Transcript_42701/g.63339 Transcript_42701/m.63339 type:complete len:173 (+) Transcript_42701:202-720(+)